MNNKTADTDVLIRLDGISQRHGAEETAATALSGVDLTVRVGELVAVIGASGSAKSTPLTIAGGLSEHTTGEVIIDGLWAFRPELKNRSKTLGRLFQDFTLIPALPAIENVAPPFEVDGWKHSRARSAARDALSTVELADSEPPFPEDLSGWQQLRVAIARTSVPSCRIIFADERT